MRYKALKWLILSTVIAFVAPGLRPSAPCAQAQSILPLGPMGSEDWWVTGDAAFVPAGGLPEGSRARTGEPAAPAPFFAVSAASGRSRVARILSRASHPAAVDAHRHIADLTFTAGGPAALVEFRDPALPLAVSLDLCAPRPPQDPDLPDLPLALFEVRLRGTHADPIDLSLVLAWPLPAELLPATHTVERASATAVCAAVADAGIAPASAVSGLVLAVSGTFRSDFVFLNAATVPGFWPEFARMGRIPSVPSTAATHLAVVLTGRLAPGESNSAILAAGWPAADRSPDHGMGRTPGRLTAMGWFGLANRRSLWQEVLAPALLLADSTLPGWYVDQLLDAQNYVPPGDTAGDLPVRQLAHILHSEYERRDLARIAEGLVETPADDAIQPVDLVRRCLWTLNLAAYVAESGDRVFAARHWEAVRASMSELQRADLEADSLPEGGSAFCSRPGDAYAAVDTAILAVAAFEAAADLARRIEDPLHAESYQAKAAAARNSLLRRFWTGAELHAGYRALTSTTDRGSLATSLLGDWCGRMAGVEVLPADSAALALGVLLGVHECETCPLPSLAAAESGEVLTCTAPLAVAEMALAAEAVALGYPAEGFALLERLSRNDAAALAGPGGLNGSIEFPTGEAVATDSAPSSPARAAWQMLNALAGAHLDVQNRTLTLTPRLLPGDESLRMPIFFAGAWLWIEYAPADRVFSIRVLRSFSAIPAEIRYLRRDTGSEPVRIPPFRLREGAFMDLWPYLENPRESDTVAP